MEPIAIDDVVARLNRQEERIEEFLRKESMSLEVYRLGVGEDDPQDPHSEDEVYYILSGTAKIQIADDTFPVEVGDVIFVERGVEHFFFDITEELVTLIFFAPPFSG